MSVETQWFSTYPKHTFHTYSYYLRTLYKEPAYRISVDAGFTCPHRSRDKNTNGCIYCGSPGSRAPYLGEEDDIRRQIQGGIGFMKKRYNARLYLLYFQAFSNTNAPPERLKSIYDFALTCAPFKELIISTRPDCIDTEKAELISSYMERGLQVWVELGLQSACNSTLQRINRNHTTEDFLTAYSLLKKYGIKVAVHLIFGLPGEGMEEIMKTIAFIAPLQPDGVKIHNLHIVKSSPLYREYLAGEIITPTSLEHRNYVIQALEHLPQKTIIMRLTCDTPDDELASPLIFWKKSRFYDEVRKEMIRQNTWQGKKYTQK
jgi:uncharacterized protein